MRNIKKTIIFLLIAVYSLGINPVPYAYAQEASPVPSPEQIVVVESSPAPESSPEPSPSLSPDPSPTPEPIVSPSPNPTPVPSPDPSLLTDESLLTEPLSSPLPSPSPDPCTTDCPPVEIAQTNDVNLTNEATSSADTGNNAIGSSEVTSSAPVSSPEGFADSTTTGTATTTSTINDGDVSTIETDQAVAHLDVVNVANTNLANAANFEVQNIFSEVSGDIVFVDPTELANSTPLIINQQNTAEIKNIVDAFANTGYNLVGGMQGTITTGAAYAYVTIFNFVNTNLAGSSLIFAVINIFGTLNGNIVLPDPAGNPTAVNGSTTQENNAQIGNTVEQLSDTGSNTVDGEKASIETGDATAVTNVQNYVNFNLLGGSFYHLIINNFGNWNGGFLGWGDLASAALGYGTHMLSIDSAPGQGEIVTLSGSQQNSGSIENIVNAKATTGNNAVGPDGGTIKTGDAFSAVNIFNFLNANIIASRGFFGIINILGTLNGNIGGASYFVESANLTETPKEEPKAETAEVRVAGGRLETKLSTNVGTHVNPGDTVMFFITARNPGTGPVYDAKVVFNLYDANGEIGAIQNFNIGKLGLGEKVYISFGLVLSDRAPGGIYRALVQADGKIGPDDALISSLSNTSFRVSGNGGIITAQAVPNPPTIQGVSAPQPPTYQGGIYYAQNWWVMLAALLLLSYVYGLGSIYRKPEIVEIKP